MRIKKIELKNFKRFTDLIISDIPETSKLVLLIGSNGSGKSSLFDAFDWLNKGLFKSLPYNVDDSANYYKKNVNIDSNVIVEFSDGNLIEKNDSGILKGATLMPIFLGRSSIRIVPRITNNPNLDKVSNDMDSPATYIENDTRFINDMFLFFQYINHLTFP